MRDLTDKQKEILGFIESFNAREHMAPTVYEIAQHFGIKSATSFAHLRALQRKGYLTRSSKARSLSLTRTTTSPRHLSLTLSIPLLGRISAGAPLLAEQNVEKSVQIDPSLLPYNAGNRQLFALRVNGESMRDAGILDADVILCQVQSTANIGDIVVVMVENETTVKYLYLKEGKAELRPANSEFTSRFYDLDQVYIQGKVIGLMRTV